MIVTGVLRFWTGEEIGIADEWFIVPPQLRLDTYRALGSEIQLRHDNQTLLEFVVLRDNEKHHED